MFGRCDLRSICRDGHKIGSVKLYCKALPTLQGRGIECVYFHVDAPDLMTTQDDVK